MAARLLASAVVFLLLGGPARAVELSPPVVVQCGPFLGDCPRAKERLTPLRLLRDRGAAYELLARAAGDQVRDAVQAWADGNVRLQLKRRRFYVEVRGRF